ncbi:Dynamin [Dactylella cylindrospora]|nr:Dynamin [Dactylella cylindrospora]
MNSSDFDSRPAPIFGSQQNLLSGGSRLGLFGKLPVTNTSHSPTSSSGFVSPTSFGSTQPSTSGGSAALRPPFFFDTQSSTKRDSGSSQTGLFGSAIPNKLDTVSESPKTTVPLRDPLLGRPRSTSSSIVSVHSPSASPVQRPAPELESEEFSDNDVFEKPRSRRGGTASKTRGKMAEHRPKFSSLEDLENDERHALFNTIDRFRELGLGEDIPLPQLVVVGDQSSGKSSLLEGLTEISFPISATLCTRFATQIMLRRTKDKDQPGQVRVSIIPGPDSSEDEGQKEILQNFKREFEEPEFGPETFQEVLDSAAEAMGIPSPGDKPRSEFHKRFSRDILKIELSGPRHPHLTVVDIPGLFHSASEDQTAEDRNTIRDLIEKYIEDPRTIIMAVMDGRNNFANQGVFDMARTADPEGKRTVGIITKCDAIQEGDEGEALRLALGLSEKLHHGWFVVKNRSTADIMKGVTIAERHESEIQFFRKAPWNSLNPGQIGIGKLKPFLGKLLYEHVRDEFPKLVDEIDKLVENTQQDLAELGESRITAQEQRKYLTRIANEYERRVTDCLDGKLRGRVRRDSPFKIRTHIQNLNDKFGADMKVFGHTRYFKTLENEDEHGPSDSIQRRTADAAVAAPKDIYAWIKVAYRDSRGPELAGLINPNVVVELFREQAENWGPVAKKHLDTVIKVVKKFNMELFNDVITNETIRRRLLAHLSKELSIAIEAAQSQLNQLVEDECSGILQTVNDGFAEALAVTRRDRVLARLNLIDLSNPDEYDDDEEEDGDAIGEIMPSPVKPNSLNLKAIMKAVFLSNEDSAVYDIHDILKSYYGISMKRFTDNVIVQVIERRLLGRDGPLRLLTSEFISELNDHALGSIAREDFDITRTRKELEQTLERARKAQEAASVLGF